MITSGPKRPIESNPGAEAASDTNEPLLSEGGTSPPVEEAARSSEAGQSHRLGRAGSMPGVDRRPSATKAFVRCHPAHFIAFGAGAGLSAIAPGTAGTLIAFPLFWLFDYVLAPLNLFLLIAAMFIIGIWACSITGKALGSHDHSGMVWDEITAFMLVLFFTPQTLTWQVFAFLLFRLFDIIKPPPIAYYEQKFQGGFGVMLDDLLAALFTLLCLAAWKAFVT